MNMMTRTASDWIEQYRPPEAADTWDRAEGPFVREVVRKTKPVSAADAYKLMAALAAFVLWATRQDIALQAETLLTPGNMEEYLATGPPQNWAYSTVVGARWAIRRVGSAATRRAPWQPASPKPRNKTLTIPYTGAQINRYRDAAEKQSTHRRRHYMRAALAFHHGAGLHPSELRHLRGTDVEAADGYYLVHLTDRHTSESRAPERVTVVHNSYTETVRALLAEAPSGHLAVHSGTPTIPVLHGLQYSLEYSEQLPPMTARRLRLTWLSNALNTPVPLKAVLTAAGLNALDFAALTPSLVDNDPATHLRHIAESPPCPLAASGSVAA
ncbi:hypothetical protein ACO0E1_00820 [Curtobacterium sp. RRHDQ66]|uniref:hypothetical protein n=1 Tax=Curtobacterium guangdongense TaxID=3413380 RepID=UPI003BF20F98